MKEIRNGRLAMLYMFGYRVHAAATGQGPVENWASHIAEPFAANRLTLGIAAQCTPSAGRLRCCTTVGLCWVLSGA